MNSSRIVSDALVGVSDRLVSEQAGRALARLIDESGLSREAFAKGVHMTRTQLYRYETGKVKGWTLEMIARFARNLRGVEPIILVAALLDTKGRYSLAQLRSGTLESLQLSDETNRQAPLWAKQLALTASELHWRLPADAPTWSRDEIARRISALQLVVEDVVRVGLRATRVKPINVQGMPADALRLRRIQGHLGLLAQGEGQREIRLGKQTSTKRRPSTKGGKRREKG